MSIGFIGLGTIGAPMATRVLRGAPPLVVYDIAPKVCAAFAAQGATVAASVADVATRCKTVFLSLPGPKEIEAVVLGTDGLLNNAKDIQTIVDLSTNSVALNQRIHGAALERRIQYLDAPVSGGKVAAAEGKLAVMVGGDKAAFEQVQSLINCFGQHVFYMGGPISGTLTKLVNNQIFLSASVLIQEALVMGVKAGMDPNALLEVLKVSSAGPLLTRANLVLSRKFDADVFALSIAAKDVALALDSAATVGAALPLTAAASGIYQAALAQGLGSADFYATVKVLEKVANIEMPALAKPNK